MKISQYDDKKNQFMLKGKDFTALQSYDSLVCIQYRGQLYLGKHHDYSMTTNKYVLMFTGITAKDRRAMLEAGTLSTLAELPEELRTLLDIQEDD